MFSSFNQPIPIKPITTERESMLNPRPADGPYVAHDYSQMGIIDVIAYTLNTGGHWMILSCIFFFGVQYAAHYILKAVVGAPYLKRTAKEKREDCIRVCAIVNGLTSIPAAYLFFRSFILHGFRLHSYHYQPLEYYDFNRGFITGYFIWDIIICLRYRWGALWTIHGIFSFLGSFFLNFPVSDHIGTFFSGTFEFTNGLLHSSVMLRNFNMGLGIATIFEYLFGLLYLVIRVIGGTYCSYTWISDMMGLANRGISHSYAIVCFLAFCLSSVMVLQYIWFWEIIQIGLGLKKTPAPAATEEEKAAVEKKEAAPIPSLSSETTSADCEPSASAPSEAVISGAATVSQRAGSLSTRKSTRVRKED